MQPEKLTPDLMMSRAEVERRGDAVVDSGHDLLGNAGVGSTYRDRAQICGGEISGPLGPTRAHLLLSGLSPLVPHSSCHHNFTA
jgi:hypothetical protein